MKLTDKIILLCLQVQENNFHTPRKYRSVNSFKELSHTANYTVLYVVEIHLVLTFKLISVLTIQHLF